MKKWARALYQPGVPLNGDKRVTMSEEHRKLSCNAAKEGCVLLKNEDGILPLSGSGKLALFGKGTFDYVKGGGGSGDVYTGYVHNLYDGLSMLGAESYGPLCDFYRSYVEEEYGKGCAPGMISEPALPAEMVADARRFADTAVFTVSRFSAEGSDRAEVDYTGEPNPWAGETTMPGELHRLFPKRDFYLTAEEEALLDAVCGAFDRVIAVLNIGGVIDTTWIRDRQQVKAALVMWQGGMEGGRAAASVLLGLVNPSGRLTDTFAGRLEDYPSTEGFFESHFHVDYTEDIYVGYRYFETIPGAKERVVYPFGHGLSYTKFTRELLTVEKEEDALHFRVRVTNTGAVSGKEVAALYFRAPRGKLGKPASVLAAFEKTADLAPGESSELDLAVALEQLASYDDLGKIRKSAWVTEAGDYHFLLGGSVREAELLDYVYKVESDVICRQLTSHLAPVNLAKRMLADGSYEALETGPEPDINACIFEKLSPGSEEAMVPAAKGRPVYMMMHPYAEGVHPLMDVYEGKITSREFVEQLSDEELIDLLGGQPNTGVANTWGMGNQPAYGIPSVMTADGPAGVRLSADCGIPTTAWPCATMLACTWNKELVEAVGAAGGAELKENNLHIWLTPAVNIHRNPMCGRNFEYYSEDPLVSGRMGAAMVRGIQSHHVGASVKHFAANNKEVNRKNCDSRLSERALREIYLKPFEIIVKESDPLTIMSAYNAINGQRASESRELLTDILRGEWGFKGMVTSDWWNRAEHYKEILAGNDVKMANGYPERVKRAMEMGALTREDLLSCAQRVVEMILRLD